MGEVPLYSNKGLCTLVIEGRGAFGCDPLPISQESRMRDRIPESGVALDVMFGREVSLWGSTQHT